MEPFEPAYLSLYRSGELADRVAAALHELGECATCPRNCRGNRCQNETRVCRTGRYAQVANVAPHHGEEDCLRGWRGSGTVFFSRCNLHCVFCQNWDISQRDSGQECTADELAEQMLWLQSQGCHNLNLVTPEHVVPQVIEAIGVAVPRGLRLPIVYNTSGYDALSSLRLLEGIVDIYMPDFKFWRRDTAARLAKAQDYPDRAREAIQEMHRQVGWAGTARCTGAPLGAAQSSGRVGSHRRLAGPGDFPGHLSEHHGPVSPGLQSRPVRLGRHPALWEHQSAPDAGRDPAGLPRGTGCRPVAFRPARKRCVR
jgi:uncharacterized Fe-S radical SAM superfamily protein PflX